MGFKENRKKFVAKAKLLSNELFCYYCDIQIYEDVPEADPQKLTVDHIIPLAKGGVNAQSNLALCCYDCNHGKGNKPLYYHLIKVK